MEGGGVVTTALEHRKGLSIVQGKFSHPGRTLAYGEPKRLPRKAERSERL